MTRRSLLGAGVAALAPPALTGPARAQTSIVDAARALAQEPRYIVLDEPTASLDFGNQGLVMRRLRELAGEGLGVLFTTHDPNQALRVADRVVLLRAGAVMAEGPARDVLTPPALEALYGAPVEALSDATGRVAFLPG